MDEAGYGPNLGPLVITATAWDVPVEDAVDMLGDELIAVELREAVDHLGRIAGRVFTDDILDRIFSRFCIGK